MLTEFYDPSLYDNLCRIISLDPHSTHSLFYFYPDGSQLHPSSLLAVSCASAIAGAQLSNTPLYLHLAKHYTPPNTNHSAKNTPTQTRRKSNIRRTSHGKNSDQFKYTMPIPVVGALSGGHMGCGKAKFREFCVSPLPGAPFPEQIRMILSVHSELGKTLTAKYGVRCLCGIT